MLTNPHSGQARQWSTDESDGGGVKARIRCAVVRPQVRTRFAHPGRRNDRRSSENIDCGRRLGPAPSSRLTEAPGGRKRPLASQVPSFGVWLPQSLDVLSTIRMPCMGTPRNGVRRSSVAASRGEPCPSVVGIRSRFTRQQPQWRRSIVVPRSGSTASCRKPSGWRSRCLPSAPREVRSRSRLGGGYTFGPRRPARGRHGRCRRMAILP